MTDRPGAAKGGALPTRAAIDRALGVLAAGGTLRAARAASGLSWRFLYHSLDAHLLRRGPNLSAAERRNIERLLRRGRLSQRAIGRQVKRAASTVNRVARLAEIRAGRKRFRKLRQPRKCDGHLAWFAPCVICAAKTGAGG